MAAQFASVPLPEVGNGGMTLNSFKITADVANSTSWCVYSYMHHKTQYGGAVDNCPVMFFTTQVGPLQTSRAKLWQRMGLQLSQCG